MELFLFAAWLIRTIGSVSQASYYWQLKEYRWDRMREFVLQQKGYVVFWNLFNSLLLLALISHFLIVLLLDDPSQWVSWFVRVVAVLLLAQSLEFLHKLFTRRFKRPRPTKKALLILFISLFLEGLIIAAVFASSYPVFDLSQVAAVLALLSLLDADINALVVFFINALSGLVKKRYYSKARQKRLQFPDLKVVGITGSFGKTSVKEFLSQILETKYEVLKTAKNTNTEMGIAQTILRSLRPKHEVFVCEMGAYASGEIKLCCVMARPQIGLFTGLNEQHVALFGSLNQTFQAKWELISSLPSDGLAICNVDSPELKKRLIPSRCRMVTCSTEHGDAIARNVKVEADQISFEYESQQFSAPLSGGFQIRNVLMSIVAAEQLGMSLPDIAKAVAHLRLPDKTMEVSKWKRGSIVDDSYNVNPDGLRASLDYLQFFADHQKILLFPGVLELGDQSESIHESLGESIAQTVDYAFFTDKNFSEPLEKGALAGGLTRRHIFVGSDQEAIIDQLKTLLKQHSEDPFVFLFESRGSDQVMRWLKSL